MFYLFFFQFLLKKIKKQIGAQYVGSCVFISKSTNTTIWDVSLIVYQLLSYDKSLSNTKQNSYIIAQSFGNAFRKLGSVMWGNA